MSTDELVNSADDADMTDGSGEKVVTMLDVLQEQKEFEDDANAVLGASDEKNCTFSKGYIKRQAIYSCLTCCGDAKDDNTKRAGVCLACSLNCHENHDLVELYTKRNFRCDCGNEKFNSHPCQFVPDKTELNEENYYNQNFSGLYCTCHRPYPDPDSTFEDEMIQCIICEDWLHASHLEATVPANEQYAEMICKGCMNKNLFLHDYSEFAVNNEDQDVDMNSIGAPSNDSNILNTGTNEVLANGTISNNSSHKCEETIKDANISIENESIDVSMEVDATENMSNVDSICDTKPVNSDPNINSEDVAKDKSPHKSEDKQPIDDKQDTMVSTENDNTELQTHTSAAEKIDEKFNEEMNASPLHSELVTSKASENTEDKNSTVDSVAQETVEHSNPTEENGHDLSSEKIEKCGESTDKILENEMKELDSESTITETATHKDNEPTETAHHLETSESSLIDTENKTLNTDIMSDNIESSKDTEFEDTYKGKDDVLECKNNISISNESSSIVTNSDIISKNEQTSEETESKLEESKVLNGQADSLSDVAIKNETKSSEDMLTSDENKDGEDIDSKQKEDELLNGETDQTDLNMASDCNSSEKTLASDKNKDDEEIDSKQKECELLNDGETDQTDENMASDCNTSEKILASDKNKDDEEIDSKQIECELLNEKTDQTDVDMAKILASDKNKDDEEIDSKQKECELLNGKTDQTDVGMASDCNSSEKILSSKEVENDEFKICAVEVNIQEHKRKLAAEDFEEVAAKKVKVDAQACIRPKGIKKIFKGATFWPSNFRQKLCTCNECICMYKDLSVLFLIDPEDTVTAYEALGQERTNGTAASQYEKGLEALSSLDRTQQINALTEYNKMKDKLLDFLKSFKDRKEIVKEEDIKQFFAGMKLKREPDGVYFCR